MDMLAHLTRQAAASRLSFGPGPRTEGVLKHIETEIAEVRKEADQLRSLLDRHEKPPLALVENMLDAISGEWVDIAILGLDGLLRSCREYLEMQPRPAFASQHVTHDEVAAEAVRRLVAKQAKNELRNWPDWRQASPDAPIEHDRTQGVQ